MSANNFCNSHNCNSNFPTYVSYVHTFIPTCHSYYHEVKYMPKVLCCWPCNLNSTCDFIYSLACDQSILERLFLLYLTSSFGLFGWSFIDLQRIETNNRKRCCREMFLLEKICLTIFKIVARFCVIINYTA